MHWLSQFGFGCSKGKKRQEKASNQCFQLWIFWVFSFLSALWHHLYKHIFFSAVTEMTFQAIAKDTLILSIFLVLLFFLRGCSQLSHTINNHQYCKMQICTTFECSVGIMLLSPLLKRSTKELTMLHGINVQQIIPFKIYVCLFCEVGVPVRR